MRAMRIVAGALAAAFVIGIIVLEVLALPLATRATRAAVEHCVPVDAVEVTALRRPATIGFARGELHDLKIRVVGVQLGALEVQTVDAHLGRLDLGDGARGAATTVTAEVTVTEAALTDYLVAVGPELAAPRLQLTPDGVRVGDTRVPFTVELAPRLVDGGIRLVPTSGDPWVWTSLGLELDVAVPDRIEVQTLTIHDGSVELTARVTVGRGGDGSYACPGPLGATP